jgi:hypothetical protein
MPICYEMRVADQLRALALSFPFQSLDAALLLSTPAKMNAYEIFPERSRSIFLVVAFHHSAIPDSGAPDWTLASGPL